MHKHRITSLLLFVALASFAYGRGDQRITLKPEQPRVGDRIAVVYDAGAKTAALFGVRSMALNALILRDDAQPVLLELPMKKTGKLWKGSFKLDDNKAQAVVFRFVSGEKTDDNNENCWDVLVFGKDGKPVKGATMQRGQMIMYGGGYGFKKTKDVSVGMEYLKKEKSLYPENVAVYSLIWNAEMRATPGDETKSRIQKEVMQAYEFFKNKQEALSSILYVMERAGQKALADSLRKGIIANDPKGKLAEGARLNAVYAEKDSAKKQELLRQFFADFPRSPDERTSIENTVRQNLLYSYIQALEYDRAAQVLESMANPNGDIYNTLAWAIIEKGEKGPELDKAVAWARRGIELMKKSKDPKPSYMSESDWKKNKAFGLGMISDTYAFGLFKSGKTQEAEAAYAEAVDLTESKQPDINERYVDACIANGHFDKAMSVASDMLRTGNVSDKVITGYRTAYTKVKGSADGFDELIVKSKNQALEESRKNIMKERVNKPAVEFALKDIDGKTVQLASLRGKVVVVDFWATWCGPCKASFPYLQKMYDKYKDNPNVAILALNTWENETGAKREELVKKFMADNKYTFPVVYDEGFVEKYGVEGIPTKFIIDKTGKIQFKSIGFMNGQKMMDEMTIEIDMLLGDEFYSMK